MRASVAKRTRESAWVGYVLAMSACGGGSVCALGWVGLGVGRWGWGLVFIRCEWGAGTRPPPSRARRGSPPHARTGGQARGWEAWGAGVSAIVVA